MSDTGKWQVIVEGDRAIVYPLNDTHDHILEMCPCPCKPRVEVANDGITPVIIHNSFDGREAVEWAKEILDKL